jgi:hypothetical protein
MARHKRPWRFPFPVLLRLVRRNTGHHVAPRGGEFLPALRPAK